MQDLNVTIVQPDLVWENPKANCKMFDELLEKMRRPTDLVILPEMFSTGFTMNADAMSESMTGNTVNWMKKKASELDILLMGSLIIKQGKKYHNRLVCVFPDKSVEFYDKRHLFQMAKEDETFSAGEQHLILEWKGWRIMPQICYDLRFPVWSRNRLYDPDWKYDLLVYVANWPDRRAHHWRRLLPARAIENQCYVAAVNRLGIDENQIAYRGDSAIFDFNGDFLGQIINRAGTETVKLSGRNLTDYRVRFPSWQDADRFDFV